MEDGTGGPFGAIVLNSDLEIIGIGKNSVTRSNDPTAHAEVCAIRNACLNKSTFILEGCTIFTSCEPCPMCLGAIYWSRMKKICYSANRKAAASVGFSDKFIYQEFKKKHPHKAIEFKEILLDEALSPFEKWHSKQDLVRY